MSLLDDPVESAYARFESLLRAVSDTDSDNERHILLALALRSGLHPALEPFRNDPLLPLSGRFVSLDAQLAGVRAVLRGLGEPSSVVGSVSATLYLPATRSVIVCRVCVAYLRADPVARWANPVALHPVSSELEVAAQKAFDVALHLLLFDFPSGTPPFPARVYWCIDEVKEELAAVTAGDSLQLPLTLAFLSTLTGLPIPFRLGATGAIRPPAGVAPVGFVDEKREAFLARSGDDAIFFHAA